ncbi:MAG: amidohydrolase family protein [Candidatus Neomarinimicrobiota bacterium]
MENSQSKTVNRQLSILTGFCIIVGNLGLAQVAPTEGLHDRTPRVYFLKGATIISEPGQMIPRGEIVIRDGLIESTGNVANVPEDAFEIDLTGKTVYPGFIESYLVRKSEVERSEIPANAGKPRKEKEEETVTESWNPKVKPEYSVLEGYEPDEKELKELRELGFTAAQIVPGSGIFRGRSAVVHLGDWSPKAVIDEKGPVLNLGFEFGGWGERDYPNSLLGCVALMRQTFIDALWYSDAWKTYHRFPNDNEIPETDRALDALASHLENDGIFCFKVDDELGALRAGKIAKEFQLSLWLKGNGYEYRRPGEIADLGTFVVLPLNFPGKPNVETWESALQYSNAQLRHWDQAPDNPQRMTDAGIRFALTSSDLEKRSVFRKNVLRSVERGFPKDDALAALTTIPARQLGLEDVLGTIAKGKIANLVVTDGDYFDGATDLVEVWIQGKRYPLVRMPEEDIRGKWIFRWEFEKTVRIDTIDVHGKKLKPTGKLLADTVEIPLKLMTVETGNAVSFQIDGDSFHLPGIVRFSGNVKGVYAEGQGRTPAGKVIQWFAQRVSPHEESEEEKKPPEPEQPSDLSPRFPEGAFGFDALPEQPPLVLVKNATIWTCGPQGVMTESDLLLKKGKIWKIGKNLKISETIPAAVIINARGKHLTPGLIDAHSHSAASSINEGTQAVTAEVRIEDVIDSDDINIYRELAGGLTVANILHGSANPIGGQNGVIKLRWGSPPEDLLFKEAPGGIKFALGENVKQSNWGDKFTTRYPQTRMGVEQIIRDAFTATRDYQRRWEEHGGRKAQALKKIPPRRDLELEALVEILEGNRLIHCHSYRQDEILMLIRVAEDFGFRIATFQHVLEGYKIAEAISKMGAGASTFTDWWAYKYEVVDAIPYNGSLMHDVGVVTSYNSDSSELARRLNTEAAKAVKYGGLSEEEALKFVTLNPAIQLGIDERVGSLEEGKDGDFVVWSGNPLSTYTVCEQTWIDGMKYFDLVRDQQERREVNAERSRLIQKILSYEEESGGEEMNTESSHSPPIHPFGCLEGVVAYPQE